MIAGVLAAGFGKRLRESGVTQPKPLVRVAGVPLLCHALAAVTACGAERAIVVTNENATPAVRGLLAEEPIPLPVSLVSCTTRSSLETFVVVAGRLLPQIGTQPAIVAMVDGVFDPEGLDRFVSVVRVLATSPTSDGVEGLVAVTTVIDDDRPLRVAFDTEGTVTAIGPGAEASNYCTAGLYVLPPRVLASGSAALAEGMGALRELLARTVRDGIRLEAVDVGRAVDVDRSADIHAAEAVAGGNLKP